MNDLERQVGAARDLLQVELTAADTAQALLRFEDRRRRRQRRRAAAATLGAAAAAVALAVWMSPPKGDPAAPTPGRIVAEAPDEAPDEVPEAGPVESFETDGANPSRMVFFSDGSSAELVRAKTQLRLEASSEDLLELTLARGEARFEVQKSPRRLFRVRTRSLRVEVLGTRFTVAEDDAGAERVRVQEGRVAVFVEAERHELGPGMRLIYDGARTVIEDDTTPAPQPKQRRSKRRRARRAPTQAVLHIQADWQELAEDGRYDDAYQAMQGAAAKPAELGELMLAADVARLSGHPRQATEFLSQVVAHRDDPRALLAAFTLGRILQRELDQPGPAAEAFHTAWSLAPSGSLAEDALAHEAECWARAGAPEQARARAQQYLHQYPSGRKVATMRRLVDLGR